MIHFSLDTALITLFSTLSEHSKNNIFLFDFAVYDDLSTYMVADKHKWISK